MKALAADLRRVRFQAFGGSVCEIVAAAGGEAELSAAVADVHEFDAQLSRFRPDSELSRFNGRAGARTPVSPLLEELLRTCLWADEFSQGLVNAGCHDALVAAGYDVSIELVGRRRARPGRGARPLRPLHEVLDVGDGWARLRRGHRIDLGGIGKGWLADRLAERWDNVVVNLGGDLRAIGEGRDGDGWFVRLCDSTCVAVTDAGVATSGTTGRRWSGGHHLIDPRTGRPADAGLAEVSVVARDALTAEILAKAALLTGAAGARTLLDHHTVLHALVPA